MTFYTAALLCLALTSVNSLNHSLTTIPDFIHVCKRNDPQVETCIRNSIEELRPYLRRGIPELKVPSLEPLVIKELVAAEGSGLKITTENLKVHGCANFTLVKLNVNLKTHQYQFNIKLPHLVLDGRYVIDGRVLLIPIRGKGRLTGDIFNAKANVTLGGLIVKRKGEEYLHYNKMTIKIKVVQGQLHLANLFGGEAVLGEVINSAINANFEQFINELRPIIEKALAKFMLESADGIASSFPYKDLFPL
ncbi:protein takeout-like [Macrosteles quadrilineatus]|uniref:protein takeout-like n=1 Tax=Macrosteles quadrilineatus TaxID=74068 RepID=UPI0023E28E9C|nr:protein takeout-like [Macrosteles quadrilineatus]